MRVERQGKFRGTVAEEKIFGLDGERLAVTEQTDYYLATVPIQCVRDENGTHCLSRRRPYTDLSIAEGDPAPIRTRVVTDEQISEEERSRLLHRHAVQVTVKKRRAVYRINEVIVTIDAVEDLGDFVEIRAETDEKIRDMAERLGLATADLESRSYFDLGLLQAVSPFRRWLIQFHDQVLINLVFGLVSGAMLSLSLLLGVGLASGSLRALIGGLLCLSLGDSMADASGMFCQRWEDNKGAWVALRYALGTLAGKALIPLTFLPWILWLELGSAMGAAVLHAVALFFLIGAEKAIVQKKPVLRYGLGYIGLGLAVAALCAATGHLVHLVVPE